MADADSIEVLHNREASRFEVHVDGQLARCEYRLHDGVMLLTHTEVPPAHEGRGIAAALVKAALTYAIDNGLRARPMCSYVRSYLVRHPEYRSLQG